MLLPEKHSFSQLLFEKELFLRQRDIAPAVTLSTVVKLFLVMFYWIQKNQTPHDKNRIVRTLGLV